MKITNLRAVSRFRNKETGQQVNIRRGRQVGRSVDISFFIRSGVRVLVSEADLYTNWERF